MNKYTLVILDYESSEVRILQVDNDEIKRKWNDDVSELSQGIRTREVSATEETRSSGSTRVK